jgi:hypothetical protein
MQQIILINLLGMCISFLMICHMERNEEGNLTQLKKHIPLLLLGTIVYPLGIFVFMLSNAETVFYFMFKDRKWFWKQEK